MATKLTPLSVEHARPNRRDGKLVRTEIPDRGCPGLHLVVQASGVKSWALRYRNASGRSRKLTLDRAATSETGGLTLAAARVAAAQARHEIEQGADPAAAKAKERVASKQLATLQVADGIEAAIAQFMELHAKRKTREVTWRGYERTFKRIVIPAWRRRTVSEIKRRDVIALVEGIAADHGYMANRLLGALSKFFNWLVARDLIEVSPCTGVERPFVEKARERTLDDGEIAALWKACTNLGGMAGDYTRLLLLLGCRRLELGAARWDEIDPDKRTLTIPAGRSKNRRPLVIPLTEMAWSIITAQKRIPGSPYVFPAKWGDGPLAAYHHLKDRINAHMKLEQPWRFHDLRRTCASGMQRLGVSVEVIEQVLGHVSGVFRGVVGVYQRHDFADEKRIALQKWADHVAQLTGGKPAKIFSFPGQRR